MSYAIVYLNKKKSFKYILSYLYFFVRFSNIFEIFDITGTRWTVHNRHSVNSVEQNK